MPMDFIGLIEQTALVDPVTERVVERALEQMVALARAGHRARHVGQPLRAQPARPGACPVQIGGAAATPRIPRAATDRRGHRERRDGRSRREPSRCCASCATAGSASRSTTSARATPRWPISRSFPANEIKIDKAFITGLCEDTRAEAIASSTIDLARHLGLHVVAEGIETQAVLEHLVELGCDTGQGYLDLTPAQRLGRDGVAERRGPRVACGGRSGVQPRATALSAGGRQPARPASSRARCSTASIIGSVSRPVNVFCWLGW